MLLEQETKREIAIIATKENTILLMVKRVLRFKKEISNFSGIKVRSEVLRFGNLLTITEPNILPENEKCKNPAKIFAFLYLLSCFMI